MSNSHSRWTAQKRTKHQVKLKQATNTPPTHFNLHRKSHLNQRVVMETEREIGRLMECNRTSLQVA